MTLHIMKHNHCYIIILFLCFSSASAINYQSLVDVREYKHLRWTNSIITFLEDSSGDKYVVKQLKHQPNKPYYSAKIICELVAIEVGQSIHIPQNEVCIIPAGIPYIGKEFGMPATLHTHAPGVRFDKYSRDVFIDLAIKQRDHDGKAIGLTRSVIYHMSRHKDFPILVALDTFVGNPARHKHNFFYDETTDTFYGIDMGASFHVDLCKLSLNTIQSLMQNKRNLLSQAEHEALRVYCNTLKELARRYTPLELCNKLDAYAEYAGLLNSTFFDEATQNSCALYLQSCKQTINNSYQNVLKLIHALESYLDSTQYI